MIVPINTLAPLITDLLGSGIRVRISAPGSSMWPLLRHGAIVELESTAGQQITIGDIVLARRSNGPYVLHRVISHNDRFFYLAGDAQGQSEGPFEEEAILGKAVILQSGNSTVYLKNFHWRFWGWIWARTFPFGQVFLQTLHSLKKSSNFFYSRGLFTNPARKLKDN